MNVKYMNNQKAFKRQDVMENIIDFVLFTSKKKMEESELEKKALELLKVRDNGNNTPLGKIEVFEFYRSLPEEVKTYIDHNNKYNWIIREARFRF